MNGRIGRAVGVMLLGVFLAGCETYKPYTNPGVPLPTLKRVAVMTTPNSKEKARRADDIAKVLEKRGIEAVVVPPGDAPPKDVDGYFTYTDNWQWDLTMYLAELQIELREVQTGRLLASASYKQSYVHRYPNPIDIVDNLIGQILGEPPKKQARDAQAPENRDLIRH